MKRFFFLLLLLVAPCLTYAQNAHELFQKALRLERVNSDLTGAIALYQEIADKHADNRDLAAQALAQMGQAYETLGKTGAVRAYERIIRDFSDQADMVTFARARLAVLRPPADEPAGSDEVVVRQIPLHENFSKSNSTVRGAQISSDGRFLLNIDWTQPTALALQDLESGAFRRLTDRSIEGGNPWQISLSKDGTSVAFYIVAQDSLRVRLLDLNTGEGKTLLSGAIGAINTDSSWFAQVLDWSDDGKRLLMVIERGLSRELGLLSIEDGKWDVFRTQSTRVASACIGWNDRYIIEETRPNDSFRGQREIVSISTVTREESVLFTLESGEAIMACSPENDVLLVKSKRQGSPDLWAVHIVEGRVYGEWHRLRTLLDSDFGIGLTSAGDFYFGHTVTMAFYHAPFDVYENRQTGSFQKESFRTSTVLGWIPDGSRLAYELPRSNKIVIEDHRSGAIRTIEPTFSEWLCCTTRWFPDGSSFMMVNDASSDSEMHVTYFVDAESAVVTDSLVGVSGLTPFGSNNSILHLVSTPEGDGCVYLKNLDSDTDREIYCVPKCDWAQVAVSPDGDKIALKTYQEGLTAIHIVSVEEATGYEFVRLDEGEQFGPMAWMPNGQSLVYGRGPIWSEIEMFRKSIDTGVVEPWLIDDLSLVGSQSLAIHPNGKEVVFNAMPRTVSTELWVIENALKGWKRDR